MPYSWDVFLSYRRKRQYVDWIDDFFLQRFRDKLSENLPSEWDEPRVFVDRLAIEPGQEWQPKLQEALNGSRCLVTLWAADYFGSRWCISEWKNFVSAGARLVVPIQWSTHNRFFPNEAQVVQAANFSDYTLTGEGFRKTEEFAKYQRAIAAFAETVARAILASPPEPPAAPPFQLYELPPRPAANDRLLTISSAVPPNERGARI